MSQDVKRLILVRGLPGDGKSTLAALLVDLACKAPGMSAVFYEADDYFVDDEGNYKFDPSQLREAHATCQQHVFEAIAADVPLVVVSNTFTQNWELYPYLNFAREFDYEVTVLTIESGLSNADLATRNEHGCPEEKIGEMRARWENYVNPAYEEEPA